METQGVGAFMEARILCAAIFGTCEKKFWNDSKLIFLKYNYSGDLYLPICKLVFLFESKDLWIILPVYNEYNFPNVIICFKN